MNQKYLIGASIVFFVGHAQANLITNGSFEESDLNIGGAWASLALGSTAIDSWTVVGSGIDYMGTLWAASDGDRSIDLNLAGAGGGIAQTIETSFGWVYTVEFDLSANMFGAPDAKQMQVGAADQSEVFEFDYNQAEATAGNPNWEHISWTFVASEELTTIEFIGLSAGGFGAAIDNVTVTGVEPIPSPSTILGIGSIGLLGLRRKRA